MQKSIRYHIADGDEKPVVRAVALTPRPEQVEAKSQTERTQTEVKTGTRSSGRSRWSRTSLRRALLPSS
jgi:hypothetical protein